MVNLIKYILRTLVNLPYLIIWVACATHFTWGVLLIGWGGESPGPNVTNVNAISHLLWWFSWLPLEFQSESLGFVLILISLGAVKSLGKEENILFVIPQQLVMMFSAFAAIESTVLQKFADGASYAWYFIGADQSWHIFNGIGHTLALLKIHSPLSLKKVE